MSLLWLAFELQLLTLRHLSFRDLLRCRVLCRHFRTLIDSSKELAYIKELGAGGARDTALCVESINKKVARLWQLNVAWANLHWFCRRQIQLSGTGKLFEVSDGLFFRSTASDDTKTGNAIIEWFGLPSRRVPIPEYSPKRITFNINLADFAVDTMRDLIVGVELTSFRTKRYYTIMCNLYPKTVSTDETHPLAGRSVLSYRFVSPTSNFGPAVQICGNHVGVLLTREFGVTNSDSFDMFFLLDWTTGVSKANMRSSGTGECWESFCFLSADSVLIPSARNNILNIYHFNNEPDSLKHDISLLLPEPLALDGLRHIYIRSQPSSWSSSYVSHPAGDIPPLVPDPDEAVVILQLDYRYFAHGATGGVDEGHNLPQVAAVPRVVLNRYAHLAREKDPQLAALIECSHGRNDPVDSSSTATARGLCTPCCVHERLYVKVRDDLRCKRFPHLHAEQWIHQTRWGLDSVPSLGCFAYGSRYLGMTSRVVFSDAPASSIALYDFNLRNERRGLSHLLDEENVRPNPTSDEYTTENEDWDFDEKTGQKRWPVLPSQIVTTPSTVSVPEVFKRPFTTMLPYRVTETEMILPWDSAILDGERIIGLEFVDSAAGNIETLDVIVI